MSKLYKERRTPDYATDNDSKVITKWILAISLVVAVFYVFGFLAINNNSKEESSNTESITATTRPSDEETATIDIPDEPEEEKEELEMRDKCCQCRGIFPDDQGEPRPSPWSCLFL